MNRNLRIYAVDEIEQGTKEWLDIRKLKFTASNASAIMANGKGLITLAKEMIADFYSTQQFDEYSGKYKNESMQRGNDFESMARTVYTLETGNIVEQVGFIEINEYVGCSPDGLIGDDGLLEIKNHSDKVFVELITTEKIDPKYMAQMQMQLYVTGRKWCDYFGFNPNYSQSFFMKRIYPDPMEFKRIEAGLETGIKLIKEARNTLDKVFMKGAQYASK